MANRAFLASIGRINEHNRHTSQGRLVVYKLSELIEAPIMLFASLRSLNRASFSDAPKILKDYHGRSVFGLRNQLFGDAMICVSMKSSFFSRKLLQMSLGTFRTAALKICPKVVYLGSDFFYLLPREFFARRVHSNVLDAKIDTKNIYRLIFRWLRNIDYNTKIEGPFVENQISLASDPVHSWSMIIADQNGQLDSTIESQQRDPVKSLPGHDSLIVDDCSIKTELWLNGLVSLVSLGCFGNCSYSHLSGDAKLFSDLMINNLLQLDFIGGMKLKRFLSDEVAGGVKLMHGLKKSLILFRLGFKFNLKSLHHNIDLIDLWVYMIYGRNGIPPTTKVVGLLPNRS